jgi:hypothetical protein
LLTVLISCATHHTTSGRRYEFLKRIERLALSSPRQLNNTATSPLPLQAGQWVTFFTRSKKGQRMELGLTTYKVLKMEGSLTTLEIETEGPESDKVIVLTYEIENYPVSDVLGPTKGEMDKLANKIYFKSVMLKQGDEPAKVMPPDVLKKAGAITQKALAKFYRIGNGRLASCSSPYLQSGQCSLYNYEGEVAGRSGKGLVLGHSEVPIVHFIQSEDDKSITQVINFGLAQ